MLLTFALLCWEPARAQTRVSQASFWMLQTLLLPGSTHKEHSEHKVIRRPLPLPLQGEAHKTRSTDPFTH